MRPSFDSLTLQPCPSCGTQLPALDGVCLGRWVGVSGLVLKDPGFFPWLNPGLVYWGLGCVGQNPPGKLCQTVILPPSTPHPSHSVDSSPLEKGRGCGRSLAKSASELPNWNIKVPIFFKKNLPFFYFFFIPPPLFTWGDGNDRRTLFFFLFCGDWMDSIRSLEKPGVPLLAPVFVWGVGSLGLLLPPFRVPFGSQETLPSVCNWHTSEWTEHFRFGLWQAFPFLGWWLRAGWGGCRWFSPKEGTRGSIAFC